jgi:hypothetical protein
MEPIQTPRNRTRIVVVGLCMFALLVITVGLGGCNGTPSQNSSVTTNPTPTPTPPPKDSPRGDTPIIVKGGGSIDLDFEEDAYPGSGNPLCPGCKITSVTLQQLPPGNQPVTSVPVTCTPSGAEITEVLIQTAGGNHDVTVKKTTGVEIVFDKPKYPEVVNDCGEEKKHHAHAGVIQGVKVNGTACTTGCDRWQRCKVTIHVF